MTEYFANVDLDGSALIIAYAGLFIASFTSLFSIVNPLAAMPVFLSLTSGYAPKDRTQTAKKATIYMFAVLIVFLLVGTYILNFFGISLPGIRIAGGLIIIRSGYSMLNPQTGGKKLTEEDEKAALGKEDISFSPLALPLLSGPGSIAVVIGFASQANGAVDYILHAISILSVVLLSYVLLRLSPAVIKAIGQNGLTVMTRLMGFLVMAISVQFILSGITQYFQIAI